MRPRKGSRRPQRASLISAQCSWFLLKGEMFTAPE
jgi:hypothetical protein